MWSQINVVSNECGLKSMWSRMKKSQMKVSNEKISNEKVSNEKVSNECGLK